MAETFGELKTPPWAPYKTSVAILAAGNVADIATLALTAVLKPAETPLIRSPSCSIRMQNGADELTASMGTLIEFINDAADMWQKTTTSTSTTTITTTTVPETPVCNGRFEPANCALLTDPASDCSNPAVAEACFFACVLDPSM